jgi:hypothetical protein
MVVYSGGVSRAKKLWMEVFVERSIREAILGCKGIYKGKFCSHRAPRAKNTGGSK